MWAIDRGGAGSCGEGVSRGHSLRLLWQTFDKGTVQGTISIVSEMMVMTVPCRTRDCTVVCFKTN